MRDASMLRIGLAGHSLNSDNFGLGALTQSQIAILQEIAAELGIGLRFTVFSWRDRRPPYVTGEAITDFPLRARDMIGPLFKAVRECDVVLDIGGGDSWADIYGTKRFAYGAWTKAIVLMARRPLILSPQTIGPFRRRWAGWLAKALMRRARVVAARDDLSLALLENLGGRAAVIAASDVAFRLPYRRPERNGSGRVAVALNVSGLLFNGGYNRRNMFGLTVDYPGLVRTLLAQFSASPGCDVHLVSHVLSEFHEVEDDYRVAQALGREFPNAIVAPAFASPSDAKSYLAGMDFMVGSRMHACIAAFSAGVPTVPLAYSRKFRGLFEAIGYPYVVDCTAVSTAAAGSQVMAAFAEREALRQTVAQGNERALTRLARYQAALRDCLAAAAEARTGTRTLRPPAQLARVVERV